MSKHKLRSLFMSGTMIVAYVIAISFWASLSVAQTSKFRFKDYGKERESARKLIVQAMKFNASVAQSLTDGSDDREGMSRLLSRSYSLQQSAVNPINGTKDPGLIYVIKLINEVGKPQTGNADSMLRAGRAEEAIECLEKARAAHQQMLVLLH